MSWESTPKSPVVPQPSQNTTKSLRKTYSIPTILAHYSDRGEFYTSQTRQFSLSQKCILVSKKEEVFVENMTFLEDKGNLFRLPDAKFQPVDFVFSK